MSHRYSCRVLTARVIIMSVTLDGWRDRGCERAGGGPWRGEGQEGQSGQEGAGQLAAGRDPLPVSPATHIDFPHPVPAPPSPCLPQQVDLKAEPPQRLARHFAPHFPPQKGNNFREWAWDGTDVLRAGQLEGAGQLRKAHAEPRGSQTRDGRPQAQAYSGGGGSKGIGFGAQESSRLIAWKRAPLFRTRPL